MSRLPLLDVLVAALLLAVNLPATAAGRDVGEPDRPFEIQSHRGAGELAPENSMAAFRQAIAMDPSFARAYGGLALSFAADFRNQWVRDGAVALQRANAMARTALEIDPEIPEVYWTLAYVSDQKREHGQAIRLLRMAVSRSIIRRCLRSDGWYQDLHGAAR